ncbi:hypothetical protein pEaSNUABM56_00190 [Erwinia phage pEa_SNUABM_56]|uniref:Putative membrane protein n=1 Tax=Erwinia phage pEp_SNUABM_01 TaxID=2601643 RepID=A0A5J6DBL9_9CAUD|nr:hypothetical protein HWC63_gp212 [Erwinia phage pEp_SNUABM_01]QEQ94966.1 putative membrane protein [Erwinia phage pEp_SNUABM_01]UYL84891.1 hypothetical protein pEaSNUABM55_00118 [Erwinia phage pEa_SNUABM_55]UYL85210.1 hypothetical protein pEaSNUABM56_00190 [Erwinia phage pEa_SNUABM_56]
MIWYVLALIGATILVGGGIYAAFYFRKDKLDDFIDWTDGKKALFLKVWAAALLVVTILLIKPLWNTMTCQFDGVAYKATTTYSWYKNGTYEDKCLFQGKNGALLPLKINRDQPDGSDNHDY